ncbi:MAG: aminotransferase class IV [Terriglobia bacterium]
MDNLIVHNKKIVPLDDVRLSPGQAGLLLGWGVFTTLRLYHGAPFEFKSHWNRMARDAARLNIRLGITEDTLLKWVVELAQENQREEGMARVSFIRNSGGSWAQPGNRPPVDMLIFTQQLPVWPKSYRLQIQPGAVFSAGVLAGAKMLSWAANSSFMEKARAAGCDDALLLNELGHVAECTSANIFLVQQERIATPPLSSGCLPGVTREILLKIGHKAGLHIEEKEITTASLNHAEEVFISSTTREVGSVHEIAGHWEYPMFGKVTQAVKEVFRQYVEASLRTAEE